ncbi:hypothetical protein K435DRAFT_725039 [Dendrothele bispora CBS 962.96]|uniref:Uncharacterized protein n=1 Tax=Dendrothele bispora (strain CBS 962.96) TaxID=1314807 RepID=A0A4V4HF79_DENBC|nr:hypothetical protein K435DRAFT_725039 [Dendrothele bispora CBS 962.96]
MADVKMLRRTVKHKVKSIRARITRNPLTTAFFLVGLFHCIAQGILRSFIFSLDTEYSNFLDLVVKNAQAPQQNHTNLQHNGGNNFQLEVCNFIPHSPGFCYTLFDLNEAMELEQSKEGSNGVDEGLMPNRDYLIHNFPSQFFFFNTSGLNDTRLQLNIDGKINLTNQCVGTLLYPSQHLDNARREDITLLTAQFWLFGISVLAMCYDSVPHVLALTGARTIFTAWSIYELWRTSYQQNIFHNLIEGSWTPCGLNIFSVYFPTRLHYQIPDLMLDCTALAFTAYLSWALIKVFGDQSIKTVGAPKHVTRMYKYFLGIQVCLQLEAFVLMAWIGLWLDQFNNTYIRHITNHYNIYMAVCVWYAVFLGPWMLMGWWGIRLERRIMTGFFIVMGLLFTAWAGIMFYSKVYTWTFYVWPFFGCFTVLSLLLLAITFPLSFVCWRNFNKGLGNYLYAESALASSNFATEVFENDVENAKPGAEKRQSNRKSSGKLSYRDMEEGPLPLYHLPDLAVSDTGSETSTLVSYEDRSRLYNHGYARS